MNFSKNIFFIFCLILFSNTLSADNDQEIIGREYILSQMDADTQETKSLRTSLLKKDGFFGLEAYRKTYFLPVSYTKSQPTRVSNTMPPGQNAPYEDSRYEQNTEIVFQFSLRFQLMHDLLGFNEFLYVGYTHKSWWQAYTQSSPFRETNYEPELYMYLPSANNFDNEIGLKGLIFGFVHQSNGEDGYTSRSWNRIYLTGAWQWGNLFAKTRVWYRIPEEDKPDGYFTGTAIPYDPNANGDGNPDIDKYLGYGDIKFDYLYAKHQFGLLLRNNLRLNSDNKGAVELSYMYPVSEKQKIFWYAEIFQGYGDSLIDYNTEVSRFSVGVSFARGLF